MVGISKVTPKIQDLTLLVHYYTVTAQSPNDAGSTQDWVKNNPTPGNPDPA